MDLVDYFNNNKCISVTNVRYKGTEKFPLPTQKVTIKDAIEKMLIYEFGYGGHLFNLNIDHPTISKVILETKVMSDVDYTTVEGTHSNMEPILCLIKLWLDCFKNENISDLIDKTQLVEKLQGKPLFIKMAAPIFIGASRVRSFIFYALGIPELEKYFKKVETKDIFTVMEIAKEQNMDIVDVIKQL